MKKIIVLIVVIILVGGGVFFWTQKLGLFSEQESSLPEEEQEQQSDQPEEEIGTQDREAELISHLTLRARAFIARWGTYSSDSNFANLKSLFPEITASLQEQAQAEMSGKSGEEFYSLVTRVISLSLVKLDEAEAVFSAQVQQEETKTGVPAVSYKTVRLVFLKQGSQWKVDEIEFK